MRNKIILSLLSFFTLFGSKAQNTEINIDLTRDTRTVSPTLYGLMTEEINHSYDGGLYAELIKNRIFKDNPSSPAGWALFEKSGGKGSIHLDDKQPVNNTLNMSLKLVVEKNEGQTGISNEGYWGIPVKPQTVYKASFYAKITDNVTAPLTISMMSDDDKITYAASSVTLNAGGWKKYSVLLTTSGDIQPTTAARFVITANRKGNYWFNLLSLMPPTYNNRQNGNRTDLMQLMADMKPTFLRLPGGNYLEGDKFSNRFPWKSTLGPLEQRPGHPGCWSYRSSDGMGLLEFLNWCEDLKMEPVLAVFAGYTLNGDHMDAGPFLKPYVDDALEEIEYVTGSVKTKWGALRAKDGHPAPFKLHYIEIGNEDGFDKSGSYDGRFKQFYDAIKLKYPKLKLIATIGGKDDLGVRFPITSRKPEIVDEHYYRSAWQMEEDATRYDSYDRNGPKIFVGEWATREGSPTPNMNAALGDAAWMTGMERNADLVVMSCYAPLFVNVNPGALQWTSDLIGYNAIKSYGSPSYYAQKIFNNNLGSKVLSAKGKNIPTQTIPANKKDSIAGYVPKPIPALFYVATKDDTKGQIYIKVVNTSPQVQDVKFNVNGTEHIGADASIVTLKSDKPEDTNTIDNPDKIKPMYSQISTAGKIFKYGFAPYSVNVIVLKINKSER